MIRTTNLPSPIRFLAVGMLAFAISGCGSDGSDGAPGATGPAGPAGPPGPPTSTPAALNMTIGNASINSQPVVNFSVTDQDGRPFTGLTLGDLRFTVAKLMPGPFPSPSNWQSYINRVQNASAADAPKPIASAVQATRENNGTLVDNGDGSYRYTFATDVTTVGCPAPCQDVNGDPLDVSFDDTLTHRIGIQTRGDLPMVNATFDFVPSGAPITFTREMVRTDACNVCHDKLEAHDARIEMPYCVTCHNLGSTDPDSGNTVDMRTMIHRIHYGEELPSVQAGGEYAIWGFRNTKHDFSDIVFPPDVRSNSVGTPDLAPTDPMFIPASTLACTKCHNADDPKTPDAGDFTRPSREACGASCHEDIDFDETDLTDPSFHVGGPQADDTLCATCHGPGVGPPLPGTVTRSHIIRARSAKECFQYNILNVAYDSGTRVVTVDFSVTNPNPGTHPNAEAFACPAQATYQIVGPTADPEWAQTASRASRLVIDVGWNTVDFNNAQTPGTPPARTIEVNALGAGTVDLGGGRFQVSATLPPLDTTLCANATQALQNCSGQVAIEGHPAVQDDPTVVPAQPYNVRAVVQGVVQPFSLDGGNVLARREPINVITKCDRCHDVLSLHGANRSESGQLCVMCHNPNSTDLAARNVNGGPFPDGKVEESIDFRTMIHAIHAAAESNFDGTLTHGFRQRGLVVYGFGGREHNYSDLRFSGALWRCETCHLPDTYTLTGVWEQPAQNGILGTTTVSGGDNDPSNDAKISPTAAVCSSCHDSPVAQAHMQLNGALFAADQATIATNVEACAVCHGPGKTSSVDLVHAEGFGEEIP